MAIQSVIQVAELVVVPTRPSPHDLRAVGATVDLCERAGKPLIFVVNAATPKARITSEAAVALSQHGTVAPVTLHQRTDYAASMIDGRTVMEVDPNGKSAAEVAALWAYISDRLEKNFPPHRVQRCRRPIRAARGPASASVPRRAASAGGWWADVRLSPSRSRRCRAACSRARAPRVRRCGHRAMARWCRPTSSSRIWAGTTWGPSPWRRSKNRRCWSPARRWPTCLAGR